MPSGLQVFNDFGTLQIDSDFINLEMVRKGQLTSASYTEGSITNTKPTRASVSLSQNEMIAFSCASAPAAVIFRDGAQAVFAVDSNAGAVINYWIFSPGVTQSLAGLQVFNEDGVLAFDSGWKLFNVQGATQGDGTFNFEQGKTYAVVHQNIRTRHVYTSVIGGVSPNNFIIDSDLMYFSSARVSGSNISVSLVPAQIYVQTRPSPPNVLGPNGEESNGVTASFLVLDVTDY